MTAADSPDAFERTFDCSMFLHGLDEIATARGVKTTLLPEQGTQKDLIDPHHADQDSTGQVNELFPEI